MWCLFGLARPLRSGSHAGRGGGNTATVLLYGQVRNLCGYVDIHIPLYFLYVAPATFSERYVSWSAFGFIVIAGNRIHTGAFPTGLSVPLQTNSIASNWFVTRAVTSVSRVTTSCNYPTFFFTIELGSANALTKLEATT